MSAWARAATQPVVLTATGVWALVVIAALAQPSAGVPPLVVRIAEFGLAGGAAYLLDDAAAQLTTVTPPGTWRRRAPGLVAGVALLAACWAGTLLVLRWQDSAPPVGTATGELAVMALAAVAASSVLVWSGDPEPGLRVAPLVVLLGLSALIAESALRRPFLLPWQADGHGRAIEVAWLAAGLVALAVLLLTSRDPASGPPGRWTDLWVRSPRRRSTDSGSV